MFSKINNDERGWFPACLNNLSAIPSHMACQGRCGVPKESSPHVAFFRADP